MRGGGKGKMTLACICSDANSNASFTLSQPAGTCSSIVPEGRREGRKGSKGGKGRKERKRARKDRKGRKGRN
jgi:hypothetical protein